MAELDEGELKQRIHDAAAEDQDWETLLTTAEWQWVDAALEDRDRLRAAAEEAEALLAPDDRELANDIHNDFVYTVRAVEVRRFLRAALEGRDG